MTLPWRWILFGVVTAAIGVWLMALWLPGWLTPTLAPGAATQAASATATTETRRIHATLFYVAASGDALAPVDREVPYAAAPAEQARRIVEAQLAPAPEGQVSAIPAGATVRALFLTGRGEAFVDISTELAANHPGGSLHESLTVYTIVNALTVNLPDVTSVQILINGREVETLAGHLDLRHPLKRNPRWVAQ